MVIRHDDAKGSKKLTLDEIFSKPDEFGLLAVKPKSSFSPKSIEAAKFEEINQFIEKNQRLPLVDADNIMEKQLAHRLEGFKKSKISDELKNLDRHLILPQAPLQNVEIKQALPQKEVTSIADILNSDSLGLLEVPDLGIFDLKHVPAIQKEMPDEIAERKRCEDFYKFQSIFRRAHERLDSRQVEVVAFKQGSQIDAGDIFILRGMLCLVDEIGEFNVPGEPYNPRLRVIFENGTESNLLLRSLAAALYKDEHGRRLLAGAADVENKLNNITHRDKRSGVVYIVQTLSQNPVLKNIPNLYKIGYTELTVEKRTENAERDTAFLESPIKIIASIECFNMNPQRFESLIHAFLSAQRLVIELTGKDGRKYHPKEWFSVPLDTAREVIRRIIDGTIIQYRINNTTGQITKKRS
jgi:Meiotically up-regulated gene 113